MYRSSFISVLFILLSGVITAQTGYHDFDATKYTKTDLVKNSTGLKIRAYYKHDTLCKISREFIGGSFSSTTIYYLKDGKLLHSIFVSLRDKKKYFEEHTYFADGQMVRWINSVDKELDPALKIFVDKEKLVLKFFEADLAEVKK
jgi:hypothetical protein